MARGKPTAMLLPSTPPACRNDFLAIFPSPGPPPLPFLPQEPPPLVPKGPKKLFGCSPGCKGSTTELGLPGLLSPLFFCPLHADVGAASEALSGIGPNDAEQGRAALPNTSFFCRRARGEMFSCSVGGFGVFFAVLHFRGGGGKSRVVCSHPLPFHFSTLPSPAFVVHPLTVF